MVHIEIYVVLTKKDDVDMKKRFLDRSVEI